MQLTARLIQKALEENKSFNRLFIAFSGGIDSTVLVHLCSLLAREKNRITAVYVHHGLLEQADEWATHCAQVARQFDIAYLRLDVDARAGTGESPEEAARNARYRALTTLLEKNDVLMTGQHREDQLETVLLQLFRGAGLSGLSGMPRKMQFGKGTLIRPLLDISQQEIYQYAERNKLLWVEDPSNQDVSLDRNFLRNQVLPLLQTRWPAIDKTVSRSAKHCSDARYFIDEVVRDCFLHCFDSKQQTILIPGLLSHDVYVQQLILREWFRHVGLRMPSTAMLGRILSEVVAAKQDCAPTLNGQGFVLRRFRDRLYLLLDIQPVDTKDCYQWQREKNILSLPNNGCLIKKRTIENGLFRKFLEQGEVLVRYRQGGEKITLANRVGQHTLKNLFQEAGIPPWVRDKMPLIYIDNQLAAVGGRWINSQFYQRGSKDNILFHWQQTDLKDKGHDETGIVD